MPPKKKGNQPKAGKGEVVESVDPRVIRFTHAKIRPVFSDGKIVTETLKAVEDGALRPSELPPIVLYRDEKNPEIYYSMNNRRLWVLKQCREKNLIPGGTIPCRVRSAPDSRRLKGKFTPERCALNATFMQERKREDGEADPAEEGASGESDEE
jgi:hypothetical protein